ncbi:MAG: 3-oxoacyl-[acyl-carrier-protein] synthase III C-terminal domain-containing protein, partial [Dietzia sp.]|nr:3-oxoacyl-[acyl-carrier-protein] synthase III C-terminal domain-containing protein [Dietzia sp.]
HWMNLPDDGKNFRATVGLEDSRNVLRFAGSADRDEHFASAGAQVARRCLDEAALTLADVEAIVAAPARAGYRAALATHLGISVERIVVAQDERMHTAALPCALRDVSDRLPPGSRVLLVAAGAGVTAGAALYRTTQSRSPT